MKILIKSFLSSLLLLASCNNDFALEEDKPTYITVDSFIQPNILENLDVLIVLDTSCSMEDDQVIVAEGIATLTENLVHVSSDFRIGIINDSIENLTYVGPFGPQHIELDYLIGMSSLSHSFYEAGFGASYRFLTSPLTQDFIVSYPAGVDISEYQRPFARENIPLLIFYISDEEEQSPIPVDTFYDWLVNFKDPEILDIVTIAPTTPNCPSTVGRRFISLSSMFGKDSIDLCSDDWENWLIETSFLTAFKQTINLTNIPIENTIVVYIDQEQTDQWEYISEDNMIRLLFMPPQGSLVEVGYSSYL